jgi:hypothetical protein
MLWSSHQYNLYLTPAVTRDAMKNADTQRIKTSSHDRDLWFSYT